MTQKTETNVVAGINNMFSRLMELSSNWALRGGSFFWRKDKTVSENLKWNKTRRKLLRVETLINTTVRHNVDYSFGRKIMLDVLSG